MSVTKAHRAFLRKLYLAHLIAGGEHSLTTLAAETGMPRRTIQDTLADLGDIGIECQFHQTEGGRNNQGHYRISDWGPIDPRWIREQFSAVVALLQDA